MGKLTLQCNIEYNVCTTEDETQTVREGEQFVENGLEENR